MAGQRFGPVYVMRWLREFWDSSSPDSRRIKEAVRGRLACRNVDGAMNVMQKIAGITSYHKVFNMHCVWLNGVFPSATFSPAIAEDPTLSSQILTGKARLIISVEKPWSEVVELVVT